MDEDPTGTEDASCLATFYKEHSEKAVKREWMNVYCEIHDFIALLHSPSHSYSQIKTPQDALRFGAHCGTTPGEVHVGAMELSYVVIARFIAHGP